MPKAAQKSISISASDFHAEDRVRTIDREATPDETKSRIFFNHMRDLTGTVRRVYEENQEVWVDVDLDSLPEDVRQRHRETEDQMRRKWLDGLSDEARRKLGEAEKQFSLRYSILTTPNHLILQDRPNGGKKADAPPPPQPVADSTPPPRKTLKDLSAAEQEFLERARTKKGLE